MSQLRRTAALALVVALLLGAAAVISRSSGHSSAQSPPNPRYVLQARKALVKYLRHTSPLAKRPGRRSKATTGSSYNWSGYAQTGSFTQMTGSWTVPSVTCTPEDRMAALWIGFDGWTDSTVEQDGTLAWCFEGQPTYYTWWEMYPANAIQTVGDTVKPGDQVSTSVSFASGTYTLAVTDSTSPSNSFSQQETCSSVCLNDSAEWIMERPGTSIGQIPLAQYSKWTVTNATVTSGGTAGTISSFDPEAIDMIDATDSYNLSVPSTLSSDGKSFSTTWQNSW